MGVYRSLTADLSASLICLASQSAARAAAGTLSDGLSVEPSAYGQLLLEAGLGNGAFPLELIQSYRSFGMTPRPAAAQPPRQAARNLTIPPQVIVERTPRGLVIALIAACLLLPVLSGVSVWLVSQRRQSEQLQAALKDLLGDGPPEAKLTAVPASLTVVAGLLPEEKHRDELRELFETHAPAWLPRGKSLDQLTADAEDKGRSRGAAELAGKICDRLTALPASIPDSQAGRLLNEVIQAINDAVTDSIPGGTAIAACPAPQVMPSGSPADTPPATAAAPAPDSAATRAGGSRSRRQRRRPVGQRCQPRGARTTGR